MVMPKHLQKIVDKNMKTDTGRRKLAKLVGASYYRKKSGKIVKLAGAKNVSVSASKRARSHKRRKPRKRTR